MFWRRMDRSPRAEGRVRRLYNRRRPCERLGEDRDHDAGKGKAASDHADPAATLARQGHPIAQRRDSTPRPPSAAPRRVPDGRTCGGAAIGRAGRAPPLRASPRCATGNGRPRLSAPLPPPPLLPSPCLSSCPSARDPTAFAPGGGCLPAARAASAPAEGGLRDPRACCRPSRCRPAARTAARPPPGSPPLGAAAIAARA